MSEPTYDMDKGVDVDVQAPEGVAAPGIKWETPPPSQRGMAGGREPFDTLVASLKANPGEWALAKEGVTYGGTAISRRLGDGFEVTQRTVKNTDKVLYNIYARYVGVEGD